MNPDRFTADIGLFKNEEPVPEEAKRLMQEHAYLFRLAGGVVTWEFWSALSPESQNAFIVAQERLEAKREHVAVPEPAPVSPAQPAVDGQQQ